MYLAERYSLMAGDVPNKQQCRIGQQTLCCELLETDL